MHFELTSDSRRERKRGKEWILSPFSIYCQLKVNNFSSECLSRWQTDSAADKLHTYAHTRTHEHMRGCMSEGFNTNPLSSIGSLAWQLGSSSSSIDIATNDSAICRLLLLSILMIHAVYHTHTHTCWLTCPSPQLLYSWAVGQLKQSSMLSYVAWLQRHLVDN